MKNQYQLDAEAILAQSVRRSPVASSDAPIGFSAKDEPDFIAEARQQANEYAKERNSNRRPLRYRITEGKPSEALAQVTSYLERNGSRLRGKIGRVYTDKD